MVSMDCDYCNHTEHYKYQEEMFQGEMWGLNDYSVMCNSCLESGKNDEVLKNTIRSFENG